MAHKLRVLAAVSLAVLVALGFFSWRSAREASLAMVSDINALSTVRPRPTHRPALGDGSFEACAARQLAAMPDAGDYLRWAAPPDGGAPAPVLADDAAADVALRLIPWSDGMMECSLRSTVGDVSSMTPFQALKAPPWAVASAPASPGFLVMFLPHQAIVADLKVRNDARVLRRCVDLLAFMRDWAPVRGLATQVFCTNMKQVVLEPCATALGRADAQARRDFVRELRVVRDGTLPWNEILRRELLVWELMYFGWQLSDSAAAELPPLVNLQRVDFDGDVSSLFSHHAFRGRAAERVRIAGLPVGERAAQRAKLGADLWVEGRIADSLYLSSEDKHAAAERALDLLESAGRVLQGDPPLAGVTVQDIDGGTRLSVTIISSSGGGTSTREMTITNPR